MKVFASLTVFTQALAVLAADTASWKSRTIYFALTDRVARNANDSGGDSCGNLGDYCGGTFTGLQGKLDYIKGMGFDAIWITPVIASKPSALEPGNELRQNSNKIQTVMADTTDTGPRICTLLTAIMELLTSSKILSTPHIARYPYCFLFSTRLKLK